MFYLAAGTLLQCSYYLTVCNLCLLGKKKEEKEKGGKEQKEKKKKNIWGGEV